LKSQDKEPPSGITPLLPMDFSDSRLRELSLLCSSLSLVERKALITLARSQSIPSLTESPIIFSKVACILNKLCQHPPFTDLYNTPLSIAGGVVLELLTSPILTGLIIVFALGSPYSPDEISASLQQSFHKELLATQTRRLAGEWNWDVLFGLDPWKSNIVHPLFPRLSPLQFKFQGPLNNFRLRLHDRIILPHYSRRGVSGETAWSLLNRIDKRARYGVYGPRSTYHKSLDPKNVTSLDVVHHYIRTGRWIHGRTQLRQAWTPNILVPRSYFAWGGTAIAASTYLRNFFNDLADCFPPTHRKNRVQPNWLYDPDVPPGGFFFYDLTSFTSWFHEQVPFLTSCAKAFSGTYVYLVGEDLTLTYHNVEALILGYIEHCNDFPPFILSEKLGTYGPDSELVSLRHLCAGFLGVPGNLATCTLAHGLAIASKFDNIHQLQVPGDDVGGSYTDALDRYDKIRCATTLGRLQMDKVYNFPEVSVYLKRLALDNGSSVDLADMLIYPLLPYLIDCTEDRGSISTPYRLPPADQIIRRACSVMVTFLRDLWKLAHGDITDSEGALILSFLQAIHDRLKIPYGAVWQSRFYCDEGPKRQEYLNGVTIKFPVVDISDLRCNPDIRFADRYVEVIHIHDIHDQVISETTEDLQCGETLVVRKTRGWSFLEDMGYIKIHGIPGEVITLIGPDAKTAFLHSHKPAIIKIEALGDIRVAQMVAAGVVEIDSSSFHSHGNIVDKAVKDVRILQSWRYNRYVDLDDPMPMRYKVPVSVKSGDFGMFESDDEEGWSSPLELDY
jgi:hypothetical protein